MPRILLLAALLLCLGCSSTHKAGTASSPRPVDLESTAFTGSNFEIASPKGWRTDTSGKFGTKLFFFGPVSSGFAVNINVVSESSQGLGLDAYIGATKSKLPTLLTDYHQIADVKTTVNGQAAHVVEGTFTQGAFHLHNRQLVVLKSGTAFVVTATALESNWAQYATLMAESEGTFKAL